MTRVFIDGIGVFGTGFENWPQARAVLRGEATYEATLLPLPSPEWLPAAERRRTSDIIRLALCAGREALEDAGQTIDDTYTVFSSSGGSGEVIHQICESLATPEREVSPTRFHNSVHNAPAGYWGIATRSEWPSTSLCAHDASFAAAVIESVAQVLSVEKPVLLLAHDLRYPEPLNGVRNVMGMFSVALLLRRSPGPTTKYELEISIPSQVAAATTMTDASLESFRLQNPAARSLPLLAAIARGESAAVVIENTNGGRLQLVARAFSGANA
jgi:Beta-ketoacyl synthase, N-terminal domain